MITYCDNAVKLTQSGDSADLVMVMIRHTHQVVTVPVASLESDWTEDQGGPNLEITTALNTLKQEEDDYQRWKKANA